MSPPKDVNEELFKAVDSMDEEVVEGVLARGGDPNAENEIGFTPLMYACERAPIGVVRQLLQAGGDVNKVTAMRRTPLSFAIKGNNFLVVRHLINKGADLGQRILEENYSCLGYAAREGYRDVCNLLVTQGADVAAKDAHGKLPCDLARDAGYLLTATFLEDKMKKALANGNGNS